MIERRAVPLLRARDIGPAVRCAEFYTDSNVARGGVPFTRAK
jgi:hypothetical protein